MTMAKILIIDDEEGVRNMLEAVLTAEGYTCFQAANGQEGLQLADEICPDLILCDILMDEMDGYTVIETIQRAIETANIPFIFLSGKDERPDVRKGMVIGADDYITKPCNVEDLLTSVAARMKKSEKIKANLNHQLTESKKNLAEAMLRDPVTQLPDVRVLHKYLKTVSQAAGNDHNGVFMMSINHIGRINALGGHACRDHVFKEVAKRLEACVGQNCRLFQNNFGNFVVLAEGLKNIKDADTLANQIYEAGNVSTQWKDKDFKVSSGVGAYLNDGHVSDGKMALERAEMALMTSYDVSGKGIAFFDEALSKRYADRLELENDLVHALENGEFEVYYQPQNNLASGQIVGLEALLRWNHPKYGMISPYIFIPMAEENDLIQAIGQWTLKQACRQMKRWHEEGLSTLSIAVNVSEREISQPDYTRQVKDTLDETCLNPESLELEITETCFMKHVEKKREEMIGLKALGISLAIDDFGTGYAWLSNLQVFPVDTIKVDRAFIRNITENEWDWKLVKGVVNMAKELNLRIIAEGVETEAQQACLQELGCTYYQGYLCSRPLPPAEIRKKLK